MDTPQNHLKAASTRKPVTRQPTPQLTFPKPQVQTPQQRRANAKYASINEKRMGKPEAAYKKKDVAKSPVSKVIVGKIPPFISLLPPKPALISVLSLSFCKVGSFANIFKHKAS
jgi:hypothetical protein